MGGATAEDNQRRKGNKWQGNHGTGKKSAAPCGLSAGLGFQLTDQVQLHHLGEAFAHPPPAFRPAHAQATQFSALGNGPIRLSDVSKPNR